MDKKLEWIEVAQVAVSSSLFKRAMSSQHIYRMPKDLPGLIYHQRALSNEFLLRAATGTSFLTVRSQFDSGRELVPRSRTTLPLNSNSDSWLSCVR